MVHAETSTGVEHPLAELGAAMRGRDALLMADCVTSLGGVELEFDGWGIDYAYSLHAEVPRRASRHVAGGGLATARWSASALVRLPCRSRST